MARGAGAGPRRRRRRRARPTSPPAARARLAALEAECGRFFDAQDWFSESVGEIARRLSRARYYDNIIADAERGAGAP